LAKTRAKTARIRRREVRGLSEDIGPFEWVAPPPAWGRRGSDAIALRRSPVQIGLSPPRRDA
jgi:hypothetical protein